MTSRGPAVVVLQGSRMASVLAARAHALYGDDAGRTTGDELPKVDGLPVGRVVALLGRDVPERYFPPLFLPEAVLDVQEGRVVVAYAPGFHGVEGETGVVLELLTPATWRTYGLGDPAPATQADVDEAVDALPRS